MGWGSQQTDRLSFLAPRKYFEAWFLLARHPEQLACVPSGGNCSATGLSPPEVSTMTMTPLAFSPSLPWACISQMKRKIFNLCLKLCFLQN